MKLNKLYFEVISYVMLSLLVFCDKNRCLQNDEDIDNKNFEF